MKRWIIVTLVLVLATSTITAFAQQSEVQKKILAATGSTPQWFFLMAGAAGGFSTKVFVVAGPFKNQVDCNELNMWAKKNYAIVSRCWDSGT